MLALAVRSCLVCGEVKGLHNHHVSWNPSRTVPVCSACHSLIHALAVRPERSIAVVSLIELVEIERLRPKRVSARTKSKMQRQLH